MCDKNKIKELEDKIKIIDKQMFWQTATIIVLIIIEIINAAVR